MKTAEMTTNYTIAELKELDSTTLREVASKLKIKNYTKFQKVVLLDMVISNVTRAMAQANVSIEDKKEKVATEKAPKEGTKSELILAELREGKKSMYRIAKDLDTYVSVVLSVKRRYIE